MALSASRRGPRGGSRSVRASGPFLGTTGKDEGHRERSTARASEVAGPC